MTLVEVLVASGISSLVLGMVVLLTIYGARSFVALGNYSALDQQSRLGIDQMTREIRQATAVTKYDNTNASSRFIIFTNATKAITVKYSWDSTSKKLLSKRSDEPDPPKELLTGCDSWSFSLWNRFPSTNGTFQNAPSSPSVTKLVDMTWKCSRSARVGTLLNTETVQTAQIVLRNQKSN
jgi:hypothetical protein